MSIPTPFNPMGTLGASPLPTGWHEVDKVNISVGGVVVVYRAPEENIPAWDSNLDVLFDVEITRIGDHAAYAVLYAFPATAEYTLNIAAGSGVVRTQICGEKRESGTLPCRAVITCKDGVFAGTVNGVEVLRVAVPNKPAETLDAWLRLQTTLYPSYLRRSHYFSHGLRYELIPCENGNGQRGVYVTGNKELVILS